MNSRLLACRRICKPSYHNDSVWLESSATGSRLAPGTTVKEELSMKRSKAKLAGEVLHFARGGARGGAKSEHARTVDVLDVE
jgi:hypothetical protein